MVGKIAIYVEGGGDTAATRSTFREGFSEFLKEARDLARDKRMGWRVIPCGGRSQTYGAFVDAVKQEPDVFNILLVDSEEPVAITVSPWLHLKNLKGDKWETPKGVNDAQCQMMVVCMEAWFLADPAGLKKQFGGNLDMEKLPTANLAESRTKDNIYDALRQATRNTKAREYQKIRDGAKLLKLVDSNKVRQYCQWCERLFGRLAAVIGSMT